MLNFNIIALLALLLTFTSCRESSRVLERDASDATIASETGSTEQSEIIPPDVILVTTALIDGVLYESPDFQSDQITQFDTTQQLFLLDTTDIMFAKARLYKDAVEYTGYVSKAILPEKE